MNLTRIGVSIYIGNLDNITFEQGVLEMVEHGFEDHRSVTPLRDDAPVNEVLGNGARIEVWAEQQSDKKVAVLIHVHAPDGALFKEERMDYEDGCSVKKGRDHGVDRAKRIAGGAFGVTQDNHHQATPI